MIQASALRSHPAEAQSPAEGAAAPSAEPAYLPHVDGLRALAIALVVAQHAWPQAVPGGFIGVDLFFVISGFIITRQILQRRAMGSFGYADFLARRVRRLTPAAFACLTGVSLLASIILLPDALVVYARNLVAAVLFYANIFNLHHAGYFSAPADTMPLLHLWSLSIEDQFYLTWPLLLALLLRLTKRRGTAPVLTGAAAALSLGTAVASAGTDPDWAFYVILPRCFPLLLGCGLALATDGRRLAAPLPPALEGLAAAAILASALLLNGGVAYPGLATLPVCCGALLLIEAGLRGRSHGARILSWPGCVALGRLSYSLYLWHWPLLALARYRLGRALSPLEALLLVALGLALAALSWRFVEQPARAGPLRRGRLFAAALAGMALACGLALGIISGKGWPFRLDAARRDVFVAMASTNPWRPACDGSAKAFSDDAGCSFGGAAAPGAAFDMAIFGDSNADHFVPMMARLAAARGLSGRQVTQSTCAPLIGAARLRPPREERACTDYQATMLAFLARHPRLKLAVLSAVWSGYYGPLVPNRLSAAAPASGHDFEDFVTATVRLLRGRGIKVMIIGQIPHFSAFPLPCFLQAAERHATDGACGVPREAIEAELQRSLVLFRRLAAEDPGVTLFDPMTALCSAETCSPFKDGLFVYHDRGHLDAKGSAALAAFAALPPDL